jgi:hypothetical protein
VTKAAHTCGLCGRKLPASPVASGAIYSHWTKTYYCGPRQGLVRCRKIHDAQRRKKRVVT